MALYVFYWPISVSRVLKDISIAHAIIIIKSEVSTFPIDIIFFRGCVPEMFVTSYSVNYCIYIPGNRKFVFIIVHFMICANSRIHFGLKFVFVCLYIYHLIIIIVQTGLKTLKLSNASQIYFVEYLSKIKPILSVVHYTICGAACFQFSHFRCDDWENTYTLSYYHHQNGSTNYYPSFRFR